MAGRHTYLTKKRWVAFVDMLGFASLVDLRDGDIMWFNFLASASGDLRRKAPARKAIRKLLDGIPL